MTSTANNQPVIRTVPTAEHLNVNSQVFGGWILSQLDHAGGLTGEYLSNGPVTTVAVNEVRFIQPILLGEVISIYLREVKMGKTSIRMFFEVVSEKRSDGEKKQAATGTLVVVAIDDKGAPRLIKKNQPKDGADNYS